MLSIKLEFLLLSDILILLAINKPFMILIPNLYGILYFIYIALSCNMQMVVIYYKKYSNIKKKVDNLINNIFGMFLFKLLKD